MQSHNAAVAQAVTTNHAFNRAGGVSRNGRVKNLGVRAISGVKHTGLWELDLVLEDPVMHNNS